MTGHAMNWIQRSDVARDYKIGDLVRSADPEGPGWGQHRGIGIVVGSDDRHRSGSYRVQWAGGYGTFWATWVQLELISASR